MLREHAQIDKHLTPSLKVAPQIETSEGNFLKKGPWNAEQDLRGGMGGLHTGKMESEVPNQHLSRLYHHGLIKAQALFVSDEPEHRASVTLSSAEQAAIDVSAVIPSYSFLLHRPQLRIHFRAPLVLTEALPIINAEVHGEDDSIQRATAVKPALLNQPE